MNISPEYLIERRNTKKQLMRWKLLALFVVVACIFLLISNRGKDGVTRAVVGGSDYIASIEINEIIMEDLESIRKLKEIAEDKQVKAVIVHINSPGGSSAGSEMIYNSFVKISREKPIVAVMGSVAASGGYMIALGADRIFCQNSTITGSIGVLMQTAEITELAEKWGIKFENFKSSALKAAPNPTEKVTDEVKKAVMLNVTDVYEYFVELVAKHRNMEMHEARLLADGRVFTGRQALKFNLVDEIGFEEEALKWLQEEKQLDKELKIRKYKLKSKLHFLDSLIEDFEDRIWNSLIARFYGVKSIYY